MGSGDVPEQIQFDGGTYTCRCGQFFLPVLWSGFCRILWILDIGRNFCSLAVCSFGSAFKPPVLQVELANSRRRKVNYISKSG